VGRASLEGMLEAGMLEEDQVLLWHLTSNHYPPVPPIMLGPCKQAIEAVREGELEREIELPAGVAWRGRATAPARAIFEGLHLDAFLE